MFTGVTNHSRNHTVAVAEVSGESVGIALVSMAAGKHGTVLATDRTQLTFEDRSPEAAVANISSQIAAVGARVQKTFALLFERGVKPVSELYVVLHAPWSRSRIARVAVKFPGETLITDAVIADVAKRILDSNKDVNLANLYEASVIRTELNGYPCGRPSRKKADQLALSAILSEGDTSVRAEIERSFGKLFPHVAPVFRSASRVAVTVVSSITKKNEYFVMHIADDATTFTIVRDGVATDFQTVSEGTRSIVKRVAGTGMPEAALSMMRMLARDQCSDPACDKIRDAMGKAEPDMVRAFGEAMNKCVAERRMPNTLVLVAHPDLIAWLSRFFVRIDFAQFTLTMQPFDVQGVSPTDTADLVRFSEGVPPDTSLALCCGLVNIESAHMA